MQIDYDKLLKYCYDNVGLLDLKNEKCLTVYEEAIRYLMNEKISNWTKEDAIVVICFLSQKIVIDNKIDSSLSVNILDKEKYNLRPTCYNRETSAINYNVSVVDNLIGFPTIFGMQSIFKEISFLLLEKNIRDSRNFNKYAYIMAIETIIRGIEPILYENNKNSLYRENKANLYGFDSALTFIKLYNEKLYSVIAETKSVEISNNKASYRKKFSDEKFLLDLDPVNSFRNFDKIISEYIKKYPDVLNFYPVLSVGYNADGTKKNIIELINERNKKLLSGNKEEIDALYYAVCNYKDYYTVDDMGAKGECSKIINYIVSTGDIDEFVIDLLRHRLKFTGENESKIEDFIQSIKSKAMLKTLQKIKESN